MRFKSLSDINGFIGGAVIASHVTSAVHYVTFSPSWYQIPTNRCTVDIIIKIMRSLRSCATADYCTSLLFIAVGLINYWWWCDCITKRWHNSVDDAVDDVTLPMPANGQQWISSNIYNYTFGDKLIVHELREQAVGDERHLTTIISAIT